MAGDSSRLDDLPHEDEIREVFYEQPGFTIDVLDDPEERLHRVSRYLVPNLPKITEGLHGRLTNITGSNHPLNTGKHIVSTYALDPVLFRIHGLHRTNVVEPTLFPELQKAFDDVSSDSDLSTQETLDTMAALTGVVISETQSFRDGNGRIARTLHDFIKDGPGGLSISDIFRFTRDFMPPDEVEDLILDQNVARLVSGVVEREAYGVLEGVYIDNSIKQALAAASGVLAGVREQAKTMDKDYEYDPTYITYWIGSLHRELPSDLQRDIMGVLAQRSYGAAALATVFYESGGVFSMPLDEDRARQVNDRDTELLVMRIMSLMGGVANGGKFVTIQDSKTQPGTRDTNIVSWWPGN